MIGAEHGTAAHIGEAVWTVLAGMGVCGLIGYVVWLVRGARRAK